jgi:hypothetical protein
VVQTLLTTHKKEGRVDLPPDDFRRLVTWIDCNCPYYGTYTSDRSTHFAVTALDRLLERLGA